jgi:hypothetical protein
MDAFELVGYALDFDILSESVERAEGFRHASPVVRNVL